MSINGVNNNYNTGVQNYAANAGRESTAAVNGKQAESAAKAYKPDMETVDRLKKVAQTNLNTLRTMVRKLLGNQSDVGSALKGSTASAFDFTFDFSFAMKGVSETDFVFNFDFSFSAEGVTEEGMVAVDQATRDEAAALIAEDGPLGVKTVSDNILSFAKAISGGDPDKIDTLRDAFIKGYQEVAKMFGGMAHMPEVSQKTYDAVIQGFAEWSGTPVSGVEVEA